MYTEEYLTQPLTEDVNDWLTNLPIQPNEEDGEQYTPTPEENLEMIDMLTK